MIFALVANAAPVVKAVEIGNTGDLMIKGVAITEPRLVASVNFDARTLARGDALAFPHANKSDIAVGINIEAIVARLGHREGEVRGIDFINLSIVEMPNPQVERALVEFDLDRLIR